MVRDNIGSGLVVMLYPLVGVGVGGVHSMVAAELSLSFTMLSILTSLGAAPARSFKTHW